jgi:hypothetical protein
MKTSLLFLIALLCQLEPMAQDVTSVTVTAGTKIMDVLTTADVLYYPQFAAGTVFLKDGSTAAAVLNYNSLFDEMHFVGPKGDTLALANEKTIKFITINSDTFYYEQGFIRVLAGNSLVKLAGKQAWSVGEGRLNASYNTSSTTSAISSYTSYHAAGSRYSLVVNEDVDLRKREHFYFGDKFNRFVPAGKKT